MSSLFTVAEQYLKFKSLKKKKAHRDSIQHLRDVSSFSDHLCEVFILSLSGNYLVGAKIAVLYVKLC